MNRPPLPEPSGICWCGCGSRTDRYFAPGHDRRAASDLLKLLYGPDETVASALHAHGFGPAGRNLSSEVQTKQRSALAAWAHHEAGGGGPIPATRSEYRAASETPAKKRR